MAESRKKNLSGMNAIESYLCVSHATILKWHREHGLPIRNLDGTWIASTDALDRWFETTAGQDVVPSTSNQLAAKDRIEKKKEEKSRPKKPAKGKKDTNKPQIRT